MTTTRANETTANTTAMQTVGDRLCDLTRDEVSLLVGAVAWRLDNGGTFTAADAEIVLAQARDLATTGRTERFLSTEVA